MLKTSDKRSFRDTINTREIKLRRFEVVTPLSINKGITVLGSPKFKYKLKVTEFIRISWETNSYNKTSRIQKKLQYLHSFTEIKPLVIQYKQ